TGRWSLTLFVGGDRMQPSPSRPQDAQAFTPTSTILVHLLAEAPSGNFPFAWLVGRLRERTFGGILLLVAGIGMGPGVSPIAGLLLAFPAVQMIADQPAPTFPRFIAERPLPTRYFAALASPTVPLLRRLEKIVHPRWPTPIVATKRFVGVLVIIL